MKKNKGCVKGLMKLFVSVFLLLITAFSVYGIDAEFEEEIADFPESYKVYLRQLHEQYPLWKFEPFMTGLDWKTVIDNEHDDFALVEESVSARIFKSLDSDDYNAQGDYFYSKDGDFIAASRLAVEYFMDPRNFLDKGGIFQFEMLNFSEKIGVDMVEAVLEGSFMHNKAITYVDAAGKSYTETFTYAQAIYNAGRTYNVNPCFLASKIRNEVGSNGSESVSGKNKKYPGIYNFYNIGATDGAGAIERGLLWASGNGTGKTSYSRPWTTPYKSIMGGAEFLAEDYIAAGQFTGYLQRFNVNPDSDYKLYSHQYMSNLSGALTQGYSSYASYRDMGKLNSSLIFSIPVFENMSDEEGDGKLLSAESTLQYGAVNVKETDMRKGPSVDHDRVTDSSGRAVWLDRGAEVSIIGKCDTDAYYHAEILAEPFWYKIAVKVGGVTYQGYVPSDAVNITTAIYVTPGVTDISFVRSNNVRNRIFYSDPAMVRVIDDNTVEFLKKGSVTLYLYDSFGHFDEILFKVGDYASYYPSNLSVKAEENALKVSVDKHATASHYGFSLGDAEGNLIKAKFTSDNTATLTNVKSGTVYTVFAQNSYGKYAFSKAVEQTVITKLQKVENLSFNKEADGTVTLSWSGVENATGYQVLAYNDSAGKYSQVSLVPFGTDSCVLSAAQASLENFVVRAYLKHESTVLYGEVSNLITLSERPQMPDKVKISSVTASGYKISWLGDEEADGYQLFYGSEGGSSYKFYKETTDEELIVSGLESADVRTWRIRAYKTVAGERLYSVATAPVTGFTAPSAPSKVAVAAGSGRAIIAFTEVPGATGYNLLYRKSGGELKSVQITSTKYELTGLDSFSKYYFAVSAYITRDENTVSGARSATVEAITKPAVPKGLSIIAAGENYVDISWTKDKSLEVYKVHVLDNSTGKLIGAKALTGTAIRVKPLSENTTYKIILRGYKLLNGKYVDSENSIPLIVSTADTKVKTITVNALSDSATVSWDRVSNALYYKVYLYEDGEFVLKSTVSTNSCTLEQLEDCTTNHVAVRAYFAHLTGDYYGEHTIAKFYTRPLSVEKIRQSDRTDTSYTLSWEKSSAPVNAYYVYRYNTASKKFDLLGSTSKTTCTIKGMTPGTIQRYAVIAAVVKNGTPIVSSKFTSYYDCATYLSKVQTIKQTAATETALRFTWSSVEGATAYRVYYFDPKTEAFRLLGRTTETVATFKNLKPSTEYIFRVNAEKVSGKVTLVGYYSSPLYASTV